MSNTIGQFGYTVTKLAKKDDGLPFSPFVVIDLAHWGSESASGSPIVSAQLMTPAEIDHHIKALKNDLDAVGGRAKRALKEAKDQTLAIVQARNSN